MYVEIGWLFNIFLLSEKKEAAVVVVVVAIGDANDDMASEGEKQKVKLV